MTPTRESTAYLELSLLGAVMVDIAEVANCATLVESSDFEFSDHGILWSAYLDAFKAGKPAAGVLLIADAETKQRREAIKATLEVVAQGGFWTISSAAPWYARHVAERARKRKIGHACDLATKEAAAFETDAMEVSSRTQDALRLAVKAEYEHGPRLLVDTFEEEPKPEPGQVVHWESLRGLLGAWRNRSLYIVAARTSVGKSALLVNIAASVAKQGIPVLFLSLEMPDKQVRLRMEATESGIGLQRLIEFHEGGGRSFNGSEQAGHNAALDAIGGMPLYVQGGSMSLSRLEAIVHNWRLGKAWRTPAVVCVDYLGLVRNPLKGRTREQEVAGVSSALKQLAMDCDCPVIAAAQLNREVDHRMPAKGKDGADNDPTKPRLSDLRDSGAIEQDADTVLLLHRKGAQRGVSGWVTVMVEKNRQGPCGEVSLWFNAPLTRFQEAEHESH